MLTRVALRAPLAEHWSGLKYMTSNTAGEATIAFAEETTGTI